jgi:hypothetical protein
MNRRQKKEAEDLIRFIEAHGGRLGQYRGYGCGNRSASPPAESRELGAAQAHDEIDQEGHRDRDR